MNFELLDEYLTDVTIVTYMKFADGDEPNEEELLNILKYGRNKTIHSEDHPEFAKLRNQLEAEGYIKTCRQSWNGDHALKTFTLNGKIFNKGDRFPCGAAIRSFLKYAVR